MSHTFMLVPAPPASFETIIYHMNGAILHGTFRFKIPGQSVIRGEPFATFDEVRFLSPATGTIVHIGGYAAAEDWTRASLTLDHFARGPGRGVTDRALAGESDDADPERERFRRAITLAIECEEPAGADVPLSLVYGDLIGMLMPFATGKKRWPGHFMPDRTRWLGRARNTTANAEAAAHLTEQYRILAAGTTRTLSI